MSDDGSLPERGFEIQTPKLAGLAGENVLKRILDVLNDTASYITKACGLHIHLDTSDFTSKNYSVIKRLWMFYIVFEDVLLSFLPHSRRANTYCLSIRDNYHFQEILTAKGKPQLEQLWYRLDDEKTIREQKKGKYHSTRYNGLNLHAMFAMNHAEIRYHSGTTNAKKILEWVNLHARIFDTVQQDDALSTIMSAKLLTDSAKKTAALFAGINLSPRSRAYFLSRQQLFSDTTTSDTEVTD